MRFLWLSIVGLTLSCQALHREESSEDGDYIPWSASREPEIVIDPNAPALPAEEPMAVTKNQTIAERPISTGMIQNEADVVVPIVKAPVTADVASNEPVKAPEVVQAPKPVTSDSVAEVARVAAVEVARAPEKPQTVEAPKVAALEVSSSEDASETQSAVSDAKASGTAVEERSMDDAVLLSQRASTRRPRGVFLSIGSGPETRYIKADQMYIRTRPDRYSRPLGLVYGGDEVHVMIRGDWAKLDEGRWIRSRWLVKKRPERFHGGPPPKKSESDQPEGEPELTEDGDRTSSVPSSSKSFVGN